MITFGLNRPSVLSEGSSLVGSKIPEIDTCLLKFAGKLSSKDVVKVNRGTSRLPCSKGALMSGQRYNFKAI